jgi:hypothetical protein
VHDACTREKRCFLLFYLRRLNTVSTVFRERETVEGGGGEASNETTRARAWMGKREFFFLLLRLCFAALTDCCDVDKCDVVLARSPLLFLSSSLLGCELRIRQIKRASVGCEASVDRELCLTAAEQRGLRASSRVRRKRKQ